jgi:hypothetical protein
MIETRYYFFLDTRPDSPDYMKPMSVHRMRRDESGAHPERWNSKERERNNNLIAAWGIGGDNNYLLPRLHPRRFLLPGSARHLKR